MTSSRRLTAKRRTIAAIAAAVVVASGVTYAGLSGSGEDRESPRPAVGRSAPLSEAAAAVRATRTGAAVEASALRTAYSTTWARPDGLLQRRIHASPVRAKVDGEWKAIDPSLARVKGGWSPRATNTPMVFSAGAAGDSERASRGGVRRMSPLAPAVSAAPASVSAASAEGNALVTLTIDGHSIVLTWPGPIPQPIIDGPRALYPEILPGTDLVLTADDGGFAQLVVVKTRQAAADPRVAQLSYGLSSPDLKFLLDPTSRILSVDDAEGDEVAVSPTPLMWDNSGTPALTDSAAGSSTPPPSSEPDPTDLPGNGSGGETSSASPEPSDTVNDNDMGDSWNETLPGATDEAPDPSATEPVGSAPPVPPEPSPEPSRTGPEATLSLPSLSGPQPDSRGTLVDADLSGGNWVLTPDQDFLADASTVYPVFIDPSVKKHTNDWTTAYSRHPSANFYNGRNFNKGGTHEARVGFESDTWGTSRSFFTIDWDPDLKGATVHEATLRVLETYAWSCSPRRMDIYLTGPISSKTTWKNAPKMTSANKLASRSFAHGYKSASCPDAYEAFNLKSTAKRAVDGGWKNITLGFRATDEKSPYSWKKLQADGGNDPYIELVYNRPPAAPTSLDLDPELSCDTTSPYINIAASQITFWANSSDKDGNLATVRFELWPSGGSGNLLGSKANVSVGSQASSARVHTDPFSTSGLKNGTTYSWRARSVDKFGATSAYAPKSIPCRFVVDKTKPSPPTVTSTHFPDADASDNGFANEPEDSKWSTVKFGTVGSFTFKAAQTDIVKFEYSFNQGSYVFSAPRQSGAPVSTLTTVTDAKPPLAGPNVLFVRAVDGAGNTSQPRKYLFYVTPKDQADAPGDFTGDKLPDLMVVDGDGNLRTYPSEYTTNLLKGTGRLGYSASGAYQENPAKDPNGQDNKPLYEAPPSGYWKNTLITHLGDIYGGDGLQDLVARREGKLWVYPGDGYGAVNIDRRQQILLPPNAPAPDALSQIVSAGDATGDGKPDFFATAGDSIWALVGYNGATVEQAVELHNATWDTRDIVTVQDITGDAVTDLIYRSDSGRLILRAGKKAAAGGVDLSSLALSGNSAGGADTTYATGGWEPGNVRLPFGTPDANGDLIPDIWALWSDGTLHFHAGSRTALSGSGTPLNTGWQNKMAIG
ncbi:DNRLRE domain-containing protein [Streptomyces sp. NPDC059568]|uniref:DNRLRE domain-containing protein n=1 Tax=Streptomyces sp. NPDC059568 TaxID=3346868 RepID=UPI0036A0A751